jgi:hypothetical protein
MITQSVESIVELLKFRGLPSSPLPEKIDLTGLVLVLCNKKDAYYVVTDTGCSCPSATYRPGQRCKHQRKYFPMIDAKTQVYSESNDSIRPIGKWPGGFNGPVDLESIEAKTEPNKTGA